MAGSTALTAALENYLEVMARLTAERGMARVRDIAQALDVHKSTVTSALRSLADRGLVSYAPYEVAKLTPRGRAVARDIVDRHEVIRQFLVEVLSVDEAAADANACRMEHDLDRDVLERLRHFADFVRQCPHCGKERLEAFQQYYARRAASDAGGGGE
ncbi:MAG: metal-dependent transcriptional regulator [Planctomycetota bacterium]